ncbi:MAG TPA: glycosyltransferase family 87 protein [Pirellulaceae bacterium]|nr:glycosyltransferase family 87 protein [Pirellulaceae bacterium]HMO91509.1 glycosyltransferase family 87 protein [Pirellulaceae bacterium]HMP70982.1 glycosyltransferase family 87 protein [Pirellulaceae bacterium]
MNMVEHFRVANSSRFPIVLAHILLFVAAISVWIGFAHTQWTGSPFEPSGLVRGWDFQQFYLAAHMPPDRLYDREAFQTTQQLLLPVDDKNILFLPLYPPTIALLCKPLSWLGYLEALAVWRIINVASYIISGWLLIRSVPQAWKCTAFLILLGFFPFIVALRAGQIAPLLMLCTVVGLKYKRGLPLSLLALKPQFAVGMLVILLVRREYTLALSMLLGIAAQCLAVIFLLGPNVGFAYLEFATIYWRHSEIYVFPPGWVHSLASLIGTNGHLVVLAGLTVYAVMLRKLEWQQEMAIAVAYMLLFTPHLLLYDLLFLAIPIVGLLPKWNIPTWLLIASSAILLPIWELTGTTMIPVLLIWVLISPIQFARSTNFFVPSRNHTPTA